MNPYLEYLRRIDEKDYLTGREHREFMKILTDVLNDYYNMVKDKDAIKALEKIREEKILEILKDKLDINSVLNTYSYLAINPNHMYFKNAEEEKLIRDFLGK